MPEPLSILFWNLRMARKRKPVEVTNVLEAIDAFADTKSVDIFLFAESAFLEPRILPLLNQASPEFASVHPNDAAVHVYCRRTVACELLPSATGKARWNGYRVRNRQELPFVLVGTHSPSKLHGDVGRQEEFADQLRTDLDHWLAIERHRRAILCGDFNMNPCDPGLASFRGLQAVMARADAKRERKMGWRIRPKLYNPMWRLWGGESLGTHYYAGGGDALAYYWHTLDHVILTPAMLDAFRDDELAVLRSAGTNRLVNRNGRPRDDMSDHLPIHFQIHALGGAVP